MHLRGGGTSVRTYSPAMAEPPVDRSGVLLHFTEGTLAYAGHYLHEQSHPVHTHSFLEIAVVTGGDGVHVSLAGRQRLAVGDVIAAAARRLARLRAVPRASTCTTAASRPNCCSASWPGPARTRCSSYLLWTGPYSLQRRGMLTAGLRPDALAECAEHLDALDRLRFQPLERHRGDIIGRLALFLGCLARAVADGDRRRRRAADGHAPSRRRTGDAADGGGAGPPLDARPSSPTTCT